jgi:hypothetical protein
MAHAHAQPGSARLQLESEQLAKRLVNCLPAATFEMETLARLAGIKANRDIPSAAVECTYHPRLLLNPDFIAEYCKRDEHLFLLVMHELWHIILAHTRLYPRATLAHNIAFDAIINASLVRQFPQAEYRGFFEAINPADKFPGCLLRPPEGWQYNPQYPEDLGPAGTRQILERLYPPHNEDRWAPPLYEEILNLLRRDMLEKAAKGEVWIVDEPFLLGDHRPDGQDNAAASSEFIRDVLKRVVRNWPPPPSIIGQRGEGSSLNDWYSLLGLSTEEARRAFAHLLRRALGPRRGKQHRRLRTPFFAMTGLSVMPNARDRLVPARQSLGIQGLLWNQPGIVHVRIPDVPSKAYVYLDVSGSMASLLPHLLGLLLPYVAAQAEVFQFSTLVEPMPFEELRQAKLNTTRGTDINCVLNHLLEPRKPPVKRALILTDGYTGSPNDELAQRLAEQAVKLHIVLPYESAWREDLEPIAATMTTLPPVRPPRSPLGG